MGKAAANMPNAARIHYNYGLLLQHLGKSPFDTLVQQLPIILRERVEIQASS